MCMAYLAYRSAGAATGDDAARKMILEGSLEGFHVAQYRPRAAPKSRRSVSSCHCIVSLGSTISRHTGKPFIAFVTDARLAHAHQLVTQTELSINEIAFESGFGSLSRFHTSFRERFGLAPRKMREHE